MPSGKSKNTKRVYIYGGTYASRHAAASKFKALYKGYKHRKRQNNTFKRNTLKKNTQTSLGRSKKKMTISRRVKALEAGSKKHWDYESTVGELIGQNGTGLNNSNNSYSGLLAIQGPLCNDIAGDPTGLLTESEQRMSDEIFVKSVRLRGVLYGLRANDTLAPDAMPNMTIAGQAALRQMCHSRIWITVLQDMRPSTVGANGVSEVNPLPQTAGQIPIESIYQSNLLGTYGVENALRSYDSTRFKVLHQECHNTSGSHPKYFDIKLKINRKCKYVAPRSIPPNTPPPANPPAVPYNYNILVYFTTLNQIHPSIPVAWSTLLSPPKLAAKTSRTYFIDA